jgi:AmpD protein
VQLFTNRLDATAHPYFGRSAPCASRHTFLVRRDGELIQFVSCRQRAWHAGALLLAGTPRCNDFSLGIELEGCDELPFEDAQYACLLALLKRLRAYIYPVAAVVGHSDIAPGPQD